MLTPPTLFSATCGVRFLVFLRREKYAMEHLPYLDPLSSLNPVYFDIQSSESCIGIGSAMLQNQGSERSALASMSQKGSQGGGKKKREAKGGGKSPE
jgi:hypothetical protein